MNWRCVNSVRKLQRLEKCAEKRENSIKTMEEAFLAGVVALVDDLFFQAKLRETARQAGVELHLVTSAEALLDRARQGPAALYLVDLNARGNPLGAIKQLRAQNDNTRLVAYLSHVQTELAERARAAGCNEVLPRSKFTRELASILQRARNEAGR